MEHITSKIFSLIIPKALALSPPYDPELAREDRIDLLKQILALYGVPIAILVMVAITSFIVYKIGKGKKKKWLILLLVILFLAWVSSKIAYRLFVLKFGDP